MDDIRPMREGSHGRGEQAASSLTAALLGPQSRQTPGSDDYEDLTAGGNLPSSGERDADLASTAAMPMPERSSIGSGAAAGFMVGSPW